jgi:hypothetical protein
MHSRISLHPVDTLRGHTEKPVGYLLDDEPGDDATTACLYVDTSGEIAIVGGAHLQFAGYLRALSSEALNLAAQIEDRFR